MNEPIPMEHLVETFMTRNGKGVVIFGRRTSMLPTLAPGELIRVAPVAWDSLAPGEVVVFRAGNAFVAHRLVWRRGFVAVTKGDNNAFCDPPISVFDIVGVVEGKRSRRALWYYFVRNRIRHYVPMPLRRLVAAARSLRFIR